MEEKNLKKYLLGFIVISLLIALLGIQSVEEIQRADINLMNEPQLKLLDRSLSLSQYEDHDPISIYLNYDFQTQAANEGWSGNGTQTNPYIIEGLKIDDSTSDLIEVRVTSVHFIIRNCLLIGGNYYSGIDLYNVKNAQIFNNTISNNLWGIELTDLESECDVSIVNNTVFNNGIYGIELEDSDDVTIVNNTVYNSHLEAISLDGSAHIHLINNVLYNNSEGIDLYSSDHNTISNNRIYNNKNAGISLANSSNNTLLKNFLFNNTGYGIRLLRMYLYDINNNTRISNNSLAYNSNYGLFLDNYSSNSSIQWNDFFNNSLDHPTQACDNGSTNTFIYNYWNDWTTPDSDSNGFVDNPYAIDGSAHNQDPYPLVNPLGSIPSFPPTTSLPPTTSSSTSASISTLTDTSSLTSTISSTGTNFLNASIFSIGICVLLLTRRIRNKEK